MAGAEDEDLLVPENGRPPLRGLGDVSMTPPAQHDVSMADPGGTDLDKPPSPRILKFELQLYKLRDGEYCIDVQVGISCKVQSTGCKGEGPVCRSGRVVQRVALRTLARLHACTTSHQKKVRRLSTVSSWCCLVLP